MNLLEEAKIRYPIGTVFSNKNLGYNCTNIKIRNSLFHEGGHNTIWLSDGGAERETGIFTLYERGQWAEVTDYAIPEKWCVKVNSSHLDYPELYQWRLESPVSCNWTSSGYIHSSGAYYHNKKESYTEIRIEDFIKYIYKGETKNAEDPKYVKCIKNDMPDWMHGEVGKYYEIENWEFSSEDCKLKGFPNSCNRKRFTPATEEEYLAQNPIKENVMEDYTGKYIKAKVDSPQCTGVKKGETIKIVKALDTHVYMLDVTKSGVSCMDIYRPLDLSHWELVEGPSLVGRYVRFIKQIDPRLPIGCYDLIVGEESNYISLEKYLACNKSRVGRDLEIMPEGFTPEQSTAETILDKWLRETKELNLSLKELTSRIAVCDYSEVYIKLEGSHSDSKAKILYDMWNTTSTIEQAIPEYVECINDVACSGELSKGKIYKVIEHDGFEKTYKLKDLVCPRDVSRFKPSTKESYDRQEYVVVQYGSVDITFGDSYTAGLGDPKAYTGKIPKLHMADEAGQWVTDRFIGKTWVSERGISTFWPIKFDTYKPEKKQIKIIELPKVKKRFVY